MSSGTSPRKAARPPRGRSSRIRRVLYLVLVMNLAVVVAKGVAWWSSNALSVAAEASHSSLDALNNVIALSFARIAAAAPDAEHPYGHQKFETLGALVVVGFLSIMVFELVRGAIMRLLSDPPLEVAGTPLAIGILGLTIIVGFTISWYESVRGRELDSELLLADATHTRSDALSAVAVLGGLFAVRAGYPQVDPWMTLLVAMLIAYTGWQIIRRSVPVLVDERAVEARSVKRIAQAQEGVRGCYGVRSRGSEGRVFAELTVAVDPGLNVAQAHAIADLVELRVAEEVGAIEVVVHVEPSSPEPDGPRQGGS